MSLFTDNFEVARSEAMARNGDFQNGDLMMKLLGANPESADDVAYLKDYVFDLGIQADEHRVAYEREGREPASAIFMSYLDLIAITTHITARWGVEFFDNWEFFDNF